MKTLLQINTTANSGSTGRIAEGIGKCAQGSGFESWIAYGRNAMPSESKLIRIGKKTDCWAHGMESRIWDNHGQASRYATRNFLRRVEDVKPDVVHLHNIHGYYLNYPMLFQYLSAKDIPVVWTLHDCWPFTGHCAHFDFCGCGRWKSGCYDCPQQRSYPASFLLDRSRRNWLSKKHFFSLPRRMVIVPVSHWLAGLVKESMLKYYPVQVIHNGIDTERFAPCSGERIRARYHWGNEKILLGVASVWSPRKGLADFLALASRLPQGYRIVLVGLDSRRHAELPANVTAIARTESVQELTELYSAADLVLNLSYEETFGLTSVEGFACGTPGIAYHRTASPELFSGKVGCIVESGNIPQLEYSVEMLLSKKKSDYSGCCRSHALAHFRQQDRFQEYMDLYGQCFE